MGNVPCGRGGTTDADAGWKQQNKQQDTNVVYKFMNLQKGGTLIDAYNREENGLEAVRNIVRDELDSFMYGHGKGKTIRKIDFIKWKRQCKTDLKRCCYVETHTDEQLLAHYVEDRYAKFEDHEACWDINIRGGVGETPLHVCILCDTPTHNEIAKILLMLYPKLSLDIYEGPEYYGESALHIAIVYGEFDMVKRLVESGANVNQRATGTFFLPEDQKMAANTATNYEGYAYYGEYPLAFAACFGHEEIYDYLIDHEADPNLQDSFGNSVLHMLVVNNQIGMFGYVVKHHVTKANMELENEARLTPLTLASKLGRNEIFKEIIELQSIEIWRYSNITCATYPLSPIDSIGKNGKINWSSALTYLTDGGKDDHLEMLGGGVIRQLLDEKWKTFARRRFFERLVLAVLHLLMLSVAIYTRPDGKETEDTTHTTDIVRYIAEIIVCCDCVTNLVFQVEEMRSQGLKSFLRNQRSAPAKFLFHVSCVLILLCVPMRLLMLPAVETIILTFAAPCAWIFLLFFARGVFLLGPFIIMIYKMCTSDLVRFVIIFMVFLIQFSQAFYFLFKDIDNQNIQSFKSPGGTMMQLFQMTLGEFKYNDFSYTRMPFLTKTVFGLFAILVPILLLNMLIAMMANTYQQISSRAEKEWRRQWAKIIVVLERSFSRKQLLRFQEEYSVRLVEKGKEPSRGLMVIKTSRKTKARQRKGAIANWKRVVFEIKELIKETKEDSSDAADSVLDFTSDAVSEKMTEFQQRRQRRMSVAPDEGLLSAMTQLAWERDIDLGKGHGREEDIAQEEEMEDVSAGKVMFVNLSHVGKSSTDDAVPVTDTPGENLVVENMDKVPQEVKLVVDNTENVPQEVKLWEETMEEVPQEVKFMVGNIERVPKVPQAETLVLENLDELSPRDKLTAYDAKAVQMYESGITPPHVDKHRSDKDDENLATKPPSSGSSEYKGGKKPPKKKRKKKRSKRASPIPKDDEFEASGEAAELPRFSSPSSASSTTHLLQATDDT